MTDTVNQNRYDHKTIEKKWQEQWMAEKMDTPDLVKSKRPYYNLMMFPYPSAEGLHVGNMYAFTGSDIHGRYMRMHGFDVFEPIGLDGFGIHSENYALKIGRHPKEHAILTQKHFYEQLHQIGAMFDWDRTLETYDPAYYRWTQWLFIHMFKHGLAYRDTARVNFCPSCKTVLADEQVVTKEVDGISQPVCERCGNIVEKRALEQWFFRITAYAEKLLADIPQLAWSEKVKIAQTNWIGKKDGITIDYEVVDEKGTHVGDVSCFTTRPDTNFGATFVVIAPEHEFVASLQNIKSQIPNSEKTEILEYVEKTKKKSEIERLAEGKKKTGVFTGLYCINRLNNYKMPLYISDFVLMGFGTGAVVGVPGHDRRDFQFANVFDLPVLRVVVGSDGDTSPIIKEEQVQEDEGIMVHSGFLDGLEIHKAIGKMMDHIEKEGWGKRTSTYHLRDWLISRQRYWGPPIPMIYCEHCAKEGKSWFTEAGAEVANKNLDVSSVAGNPSLSASSLRANEATQNFVCSPHPFENSVAWNVAGWFPVPEDQLPVILPDVEDYKPGNDGVAPLAKVRDFFEVPCPSCGNPARRETDVSDTFLDSSWYFLRYPSLREESSGKLPFDPDITKKWLPVHMYTGGAEHSVLHLLYSRFVTMALHNWGLIDFDEPFANFFAHGLVIKDGAKMSKSKGNVVNPDEYITKYGADALRLYLMFMGPFSDGGDFRDTGMEGMARWTGRIWRLMMNDMKAVLEDDQEKNHRLLHKTVKKVTEDMDKRHYNTAIAAMMEFTNFVGDHGKTLPKEDAHMFVRILAPFVPHMAEELWERLSGKKTESVHKQQWPEYDKALVMDDMIQIVIQVNGKVRDTISVPVADATNQKTIEDLARKSEKVKKFLTAVPKKVIFVPKRLLNFVC